MHKEALCKHLMDEALDSPDGIAYSRPGLSFRDLYNLRFTCYQVRRSLRTTTNKYDVLKFSIQDSPLSLTIAKAQWRAA
jgi:hypothetical protein